MVADGREDLIGRIELEEFIAPASENIRHSLSCAATSRIEIIRKILGLFCDFAIYACVSICARLPEKIPKNASTGEVDASVPVMSRGQRQDSILVQ
jgi:hypothetical protein